MNVIPLIYLANSEPTAEVRAKLVRAFSNADATQIASLSQEQREVLELVVQGKPNKAIAKQLNLSVRAVEDRRARLMRRLRVSSLAELIKRAITAGICSLDFLIATLGRHAHHLHHFARGIF